MFDTNKNLNFYMMNIIKIKIYIFCYIKSQFEKVISLTLFVTVYVCIHIYIAKILHLLASSQINFFLLERFSLSLHKYRINTLHIH